MDGWIDEWSFISSTTKKKKTGEQIGDHLFWQNIVFGSLDKNYYSKVVSMKVQLEMEWRKKTQEW